MNIYTNPKGSRSLAAAGPILLLVVMVAAGLGGCGKAPNLDAGPPSTIGPLQQTQILSANEAIAAIQDSFMVSVRPEKAWVSTYGDAGRIRISAMELLDEVRAASVMDALQGMLQREGARYGQAGPLSVAQQQGFKADGEPKDLFFYSRGEWVILIEAMALDFDPAVTAIRWVRPIE